MTTTDSLKAYLKAVATAHANGKADYSAGALDVANGALDFLDILEGAGPEAVEKPEVVAKPAVVQVNHKYVYVSDQEGVSVGDSVQVEGAHGGRWSARVTHTWDTVAAYLKDTGEDVAPYLMVLAVNL